METKIRRCADSRRWIFVNKKSPNGLEKYIILSMFKEHYRKNNLFISSLSSLLQTKNFSSRFFSFVLPPPYFLKRKRKFWFAYDGAVAEALVRLGLPRARMRMVSVGVTTDTERWLMFKIPFFGFVD